MTPFSFWMAVAAAVALTINGASAASSAGEVRRSQYTEIFSKVPWEVFPGGRYKAQTNATLPGSAIAGSLVELFPGGLRELHWHDAAEWAFVLDGTCQGTVMDESKIHPTDTWNFTRGDVWYFPANLAHTILGMADGCKFVAGYNSPSFDEREAFSASSWLPTMPDHALAQALGISVPEARKLKAAIHAAPDQPTFIPLGNLDELASDTPSLPVQWPKLIHRFPLMQNTPEVEVDGSTINMIDVTRFPVSTDMSGALVKIAAGAMRLPHWHLNFDEWQYIIDGTVEVGVFTKPGEFDTAIIGPGDLGAAPRGSGHYLRNIGEDDAHVVLIFNAGQFTNVDISNFLGAVPPSWTATSLNIDTAFAETFNYTLQGFAPAVGGSEADHYTAATAQSAKKGTKGNAARA